MWHSALAFEKDEYVGISYGIISRPIGMDWNGLRNTLTAILYQNTSIYLGLGTGVLIIA